MRIPTGVLTPPVDIMSMRARAGAVQALAQPGMREARSSLSTSSAVVSCVCSGQIRPSPPLSQEGAQLEYQRTCDTLGHSARGLRRIVVSAIENGAGSVAELARPTLPNAAATSGNCAKILSIRLS